MMERPTRENFFWFDTTSNVCLSNDSKLIPALKQS